ncbi:HNH endonuclease [Maritimibacter sp. 55A14]|uniref:HNH endonuclease signature motif containing protein n=1 Tax=Maritimibacter sp. 55A14 TaxID=2174844 RepID=UPI000D607EBC|nr:HNH endonuclease signature motif containing protein [Maritimibacter sp. 55A14]PWE32745.1 HNH endonuclease [Maritimibacter sp. 55A14]
MKGTPISWGDDELAWIEAHASLPRREAHAQFVAQFDRADVSLGAYTSLCKRNRWLTGRTGCYEPGREPENKGKKMPWNANSARTRFKKGHRGGRAAELHKPIGTERVTEDGYIERKIHDGLPLQSRWRALHLVRWEEAHGPVPEGMCLKCLDGDKTNCDPSNWKLIPRALLPRLNGRFGRGYDAAEPELKPTILAITELEHQSRERRGGGGKK